MRLLAAARARLARVLRRPSLRALSAVLDSRDAEGWIVGGAVRDLMLRRPVPDVDLAVSADPFDLASDLESRGFGTAVLLSESFPRVARVAGRHELDLAAVEGRGIHEDLARRDFTVNAIAIPLSGGEWIDPFGGIEHLLGGRLAMLSEQNLFDDPLRALRAARFIATHGLAPDRPTAAACARVAPLLSSAAPERIRVEIEKLLAAPRAGPALDWAARASLLGPALGVPVGRAAAVAIVRRLPLDARAVMARRPAERLRLRLAMLAAGLALEPADASAWLASRRFSRAAAREVWLLLRLAGAAGRADRADARWAWVHEAGPLAREALALSALVPSGQDRSARARLASLARAVRAARRPPRVGGADVLAWLPLAPGPKVGELLRELEIEGLRGRIRSRGQARRWLERRRGGSTGNAPKGG